MSLPVINGALGIQLQRPYDFRWGTAKQAKTQFGLNSAVLKAAWARGWVKARQCCWKADSCRTQTIYCFEDIHAWLEGAAHKVSDAYAEKWWTEDAITEIKKTIRPGPYTRAEKGTRR